MLRILSSAVRGTSRAVATSVKSTERMNLSIIKNPDVPVNRFPLQTRCISFLSKGTLCPQISNKYEQFCSPSRITKIASNNVAVTTVPVRTLMKFTLSKGKRQSVRAVPKRFFRLDWGIWIRTKAGCHKKMWKKKAKRKVRIRRHVFTTAKQSWLLDTMVSRYWRRPKHWVDDPYNPYHKREEFYLTRSKPLTLPE